MIESGTPAGKKSVSRKQLEENFSIEHPIFILTVLSIFRSPSALAPLAAVRALARMSGCWIPGWWPKSWEPQLLR